MFAVEFLMFLIVSIIIIVTIWSVKVIFMLWDRFNKAIESLEEYPDYIEESSARWGFNMALTVLSFLVLAGLYIWFVYIVRQMLLNL